MTCNLNVPVTTTDKMDIPNTQRETHDMQPELSHTEGDT